MALETPIGAHPPATIMMSIYGKTAIFDEHLWRGVSI